MNRTAELQVSQDRIANAVRVEPRVFAPSHVVGVDAGYVAVDGEIGGNSVGVGVGAAVVIDAISLEVVDQAVVRVEVRYGA